MADAAKVVDKLFVATGDGRAYVRVIGRGSFKVSPTLKEFTGAAIDRGCREFIFDMSECIGMDSTFMGVLAGLALRLREKQGKVVLVNLSSRTRSLLATLGLDRVVTSYLAGETPPELVTAFRQPLEELADRERTAHETARTMLEAHEDLIRISEDNLPKFKDVLTFLKEDVKRLSDKGTEAR